ncbi:20251_t:CDS:2 [Dentiscutata erythropus]|uniref:20251_t:CDS:1 n=1 Tax=Dentiscutata erythropus TaxID=1348616 RepID=A0A9N8ZBX3_9GLOM|nr:20251_t:CDS:2 [Dentiscutata erythropus]
MYKYYHSSEHEPQKVKPDKNNIYNILTKLYLKKKNDPRWIVIKPEERRLNLLLWMSSDQINVYKKFRDVVIVNTTSKTIQFDMILILVIVVNSNFQNLIVASAIIEDETETIFAWVLEELKGSCNPTSIVLYSDTNLALISSV